MAKLTTFKLWCGAEELDTVHVCDGCRKEIAQSGTRHLTFVGTEPDRFVTECDWCGVERD